MPNLAEHRMFDIILMWAGDIHRGPFPDKVHRYIDNHILKHHHTINWYMTENKIRAWLNKFRHFADQTTLTDYIRVAFGHLVLDEVWSNYKNEPLIEALIKAHSLFRRRKYHLKKWVT